MARYQFAELLKLNRASRLTAFDGAFGNRAATHGLRLSQFGSELADTRWNFERSGHASSYGIYCCKIKREKKAI